MSGVLHKLIYPFNLRNGTSRLIAVMVALLGTVLLGWYSTPPVVDLWSTLFTHISSSAVSTYVLPWAKNSQYYPICFNISPIKAIIAAVQLSFSELKTAINVSFQYPLSYFLYLFESYPGYKQLKIQSCVSRDTPLRTEIPAEFCWCNEKLKISLMAQSIKVSSDYYNPFRIADDLYHACSLYLAWVMITVLQCRARIMIFSHHHSQQLLRSMR